MIPEELEKIVKSEGLKEGLIEKVYEETKQQFMTMFPEDMPADEKEQKVITMVKAKIMRGITQFKKPEKFKIVVLDATGIEVDRRRSPPSEYATAYALVNVKGEWHYSRINFYENTKGYINAVEPMTAYEMAIIPRKLDGIYTFTASEGEIPNKIDLGTDLKKLAIDVLKKNFRTADIGKARVEAQAGIDIKEAMQLSGGYNDLRLVEGYIVRASFGENKETGIKYGSYSIMNETLQTFESPENTKPVRVFATYRQIRYQEPSIVLILGRLSAYGKDTKDVVINAEAIVPVAAIPIQKLTSDGGIQENISGSVPTYTSTDIED